MKADAISRSPYGPDELFIRFEDDQIYGANPNQIVELSEEYSIEIKPLVDENDLKNA